MQIYIKYESNANFSNIVANVRVYEPLRDSKRFVVELAQGNQENQPTQTRYQQWLIHAVVCGFISKV